MTQRNLSAMLRGLVLLSGIVGLFACRGFIVLVREAAVWEGARQLFPVFLIFFIASALAVYAALLLAWQIFADIGRDRSFTLVNSRRLKRISWLFAADTTAYLLAVGVFQLLTPLRGLILLLMLAACFAGLALSVTAACLSHLVQKAAALKQESELTI